MCVTRKDVQAARMQRRRALEERYKAAEEAKALEQRQLEEAQKAAKVCMFNCSRYAHAHPTPPSCPLGLMTYKLGYKRGIGVV